MAIRFGGALSLGLDQIKVCLQTSSPLGLWYITPTSPFIIYPLAYMV